MTDQETQRETKGADPRQTKKTARPKLDQLKPSKPEGIKLSDKGATLIQEFEGLRLEAYQDSAGIWTIGYGHTGAVKQGDKITPPDALRLFWGDVRRAESGVSKVIKCKLTQGQHDALVSFVFNLGSANLAASTLAKMLNRGQAEKAANQFTAWVWATNASTGEKERLSGLIRRREAEKDLFLS